MKNNDLPIWNPFRKGYLENPHEQLEMLRRRNPVHRGVNGRWMLFAYRDVKVVLSQPAFQTISLCEQINSKNRFLEPPRNLNRLSKATAKWLFFIDPPEHPAVRQMVVKLWNQYKVQRYIEEVVAETVENIAGRRTVEIIEDCAVQIPMKIICRILGLPLDNDRQMRQWAYNFARTLELFESLDKLLGYNESAREFYEYIEKVVREKERRPDDSFIANFLAANEAAEKPLGREEIISVFIILFFAGIETSIYLIGQSVLHLLRHPSQMAALRDDLSKTPSAVEELIRFSSPLQYTPRVPTEDVVIGGQPIKAGETIMCCIASANRDPEIFSDPEQLEIARKSNPHLSFGYGLHRCIGAQLARDEMNALLPAIVKRFSSIELDAAEPYAWDAIITNRGLKYLRVTVQN